MFFILWNVTSKVLESGVEKRFEEPLIPIKTSVHQSREMAVALKCQTSNKFYRHGLLITSNTYPPLEP